MNFSALYKVRAERAMHHILLALFLGIACLVAGIAFLIGTQTDSKDVQQAMVQTASSALIIGGGLTVGAVVFLYMSRRGVSWRS